jgi:hypothetical protein
MTCCATRFHATLRSRPELYGLQVVVAADNSDTSGMATTLEVKQVQSVEEIETDSIEVSLLLTDGTEALIKMDRVSLASLADLASQYATP